MIMRKTIGNFIKCTGIGIIVIGSYFFGTTQAKTEMVPYIPDNYIALEDCIPLEDIACSFIDEYDYPCFELKDVRNQLDDPDNRSYTDITESLEDKSRDCFDMCVNMKNLTDFEVSDSGLQLYFNDGTGYYWSK